MLFKIPLLKKRCDGAAGGAWLASDISYSSFIFSWRLMADNAGFRRRRLHKWMEATLGLP
jgi:hypothetical protein